MDTQDRWFVEVKNPLGSYSPVLFSGECPDKKHPDGVEMKFLRDPVKIDPRLHDQPLDMIARIYSPDGDLYGVDLTTFIPFLKYPNSSTYRWLIGERRH